MTNFICVEYDRNEDIVINLEKIAWVHIPSCTVCLSAFSGNNNGLVQLTEKGLKELLDCMTIRGSHDE